MHIKGKTVMDSYKVILFDLDGTLTDPKIGITRSVQYALRKFGIIEDDLDKLEPFIGPPLSDSFREFYSFEGEQIGQAIGYYREYFSCKGLYENKVYEGMEGMLRGLKNCGKKLIVATSKPTDFSNQIVRYFNMEKYFDFVAGSNNDGTRVKKGEVIQFVISNLTGYDKKDMVMVGDRKFDVCGARENGIHSIAVTYGYGSRNELIESKPEFFAHSIKELSDLLTA